MHIFLDVANMYKSNSIEFPLTVAIKYIVESSVIPLKNSTPFKSTVIVQMNGV